MGCDETMILNILCILLAVTAVIVAVLTIRAYRTNIHKTMKQLNRMLDSAIDGSFTANTFDESVASALETKLSQFLSKHVVSSNQLQADKKKINELISDISHQTKTPIANIVLYTQLLHEYDLPQDSLPCIEALSTQADKLNFLIQSLMTVSRLETGMITVTPAISSVHQLLLLASKQASPNAEAKQMTIKLPQFEQIYAQFDLKWTAEALFNMIDNAIKYSDQGDEVEISVTTYEFFCRIDIRDHGIGIAESEQGAVFQRFYRSPAVSMQEGIGLGLYLAREIIAAEGGYIKLSSHVSAGSTFSIFLPLQ